MITITNIQALSGLFMLLVLAPVLQFWTLKLALNGMRADLTQIKIEVQRLVQNDAGKDTDIGVHNQRIVSLESRMKKLEP